MIQPAHRTVRVIDSPRTGAAVRRYRTRRGRSLRSVARELGWSATYLSDLERGKRSWNLALLEKVNAVLARKEIP